jgi:hypothetical protein
MQRVTWLKDQFDMVHIWTSEIVPYPTMVDTADISIETGLSSIFVPEVLTAGVFDWGWTDVPLEVECEKEKVYSEEGVLAC